jgi:site-specific recombinase XerD
MEGCVRSPLDNATKEFMTQVLGDTDVTFRKITITNIEEYIAHKASVYKPETAKSYVTALRVFFRFLRATDRLQNPLDEAVPTVAHRRLSTLPKYIDEMQLKTLLSSFDLKLPLDKRDYAMTHLMATTGIRCGEVAALRLDDINWRDGSISIIETKSRRPDQMPLPAETCEALIVYLQSGRPTTDARNIFVTHVAPLGKPLSTGAISSAIRKAFHRSMPDLPSRGTHALRHTLATRLLRNGASLKEIADILRHRSIETTAIYAKVDTQSLQRVIVPWPEVIL